MHDDFLIKIIMIISTSEQMLKELTDLVQDEDDSMYDFLATTMYDLHEMSYRGYDPNFLAHEMTKHVHAQLFNDTIDYLLGTSLLGMVWLGLA